MFINFQACLLAKDELIIFYGDSSFRHEPVIRRGEELLKKKTSGVQFDDAKLINRLFLLFNGMKSLTICYILIFQICLSILRST